MLNYKHFSFIPKKLNHYLAQMSNCELCKANVGITSLRVKALQQKLLCQHCINSLPLFKYDLLMGNLLNWPAINKALPNTQFDQLFSLAPYMYPFDRWISQLKYQGRFDMAQCLSTLLYAHWFDVINQADLEMPDLIVSVPLHTKKWQNRCYNQAHLLAKFFAKQTDITYRADIISRIKNTESQMGKTGRQRRQNLSNSFQSIGLPNDCKHVMIIDDVVTTGTTVNEICKLLKSAGVEVVSVMSVCLSLPSADAGKQKRKTIST